MAKKRARREDDDLPESDKPRSDAYVGLLAISLLALLVGATLLYVDFDELKNSASPAPTIALSDDGLNAPKAAGKS
jgi:hypothetical protein